MSVESELKEHKDLIAKAKKGGWLIKHRRMNLIFTPEGFIDTLKKGAWHSCPWELVSKTAYGNMLRAGVRQAQKEYEDFVKLIEKG